MQFVSTVSSFVHIMIRHNVDFCKNEPRFMLLIIFHLNCILLLMMKMNKKQFLFHSWKIRAEGRSPLIEFIFVYITLEAFSPKMDKKLFLYVFLCEQYPIKVITIQPNQGICWMCVFNYVLCKCDLLDDKVWCSCSWIWVIINV